MHACSLVSGPISSAVPLLDEQGVGGKVLIKTESSCTDSSGDEQSSEPLNTLPSTESGVLSANDRVSRMSCSRYYLKI